jgi:hypothetical protein
LRAHGREREQQREHAHEPREPHDFRTSLSHPDGILTPVKPGARRFDVFPMPMGFDLQTLVLAGTIISAVIAALYALASLVRNETEMHQLKLRVHQMRAEYLRRAREGIDAHNADPNADVDIVDTVPEPAQQRKAA